MRRYEDTLLGESIDDDQNSGESEGLRKLLDEVHGDGVPGLLGDRELLESSVWLVPGRLGSLTSRAGLAIVLDKPADSGLRTVTDKNNAYDYNWMSSLINKSMQIKC